MAPGRRVAAMRRKAQVHGRRTDLGGRRHRRRMVSQRARMDQRGPSRRLRDSSRRLSGARDRRPRPRPGRTLRDPRDHVRHVARRPTGRRARTRRADRVGVPANGYARHTGFGEAPFGDRRETARPADDPELAQHAANAIAQHSRRGWRISKPTKRTHIDGIIALMMSLDRLENQPKPVEVLGWL